MHKLRLANSVLLGLALALPAVLHGVSAPGDRSPQGTLELVAVEVTPSNPGPASLCRLAVKVRNATERPASRLRWRVLINDVEVTNYRNRLFLEAVEPQAVTDVSLYRFWARESSRPAAAGDTLTLRVELTEAHWMKRQVGDSGEEVWHSAGEVEGVPLSLTTTLTLKDPLSEGSAP